MPPPPAIEPPRDHLFAGTLRLAVDATDLRHKVFAVHEIIPIPGPGPIALLYPRWETSSHAATAAVVRIAGLAIRGGDRALAWQRDPVDAHAFHVDVPAGVAQLELDFQYLSPPTPRAGSMVMSPAIINVQWQNLVLYPAGWFARNLTVEASLQLPPGFAAASSLDVARAAGDRLAYAPVTLEALVDAPVYAGRHLRRIDLGAGARAPYWLDLIGDTPADLAIPPAQLDALRALVGEAEHVFGPLHGRHYDFLVSLSEHVPSDGGLEHLESGEDNLPAGFFQHTGEHLGALDLIAHELAHAWNGRARVPADLWTPNFNVAMRDSLLWVYEGQTQFWGFVLAARAGMRTVADTLDALAIEAAVVAARPGRRWKSLADSSLDPLSAIGQAVVWRDWQRREDYYPEGVLLWLDVDGVLRERTAGRRGLDDVARAFFSAPSGAPGNVPLTYQFDDVCDALGQVASHDWRGYLRGRLDSHSDAGVLDGLGRAGYRLVFAETRTAAFRDSERGAGASDLSYSLGLSVAGDGTVKTVAWDGPAFRAGLTVGARITAVNGAPFRTASVEVAVQHAAATQVVLEFEVDGDAQRAAIEYRGTLRYPRLERIPGTADGLAELLRPHRGVPPRAKP